MKKSIVARVLWVVVAAPLLAGCVYYRTPPPQPAPQAEVIPPAPGSVAVWYWVPGDWAWHGRWVWRGGYWARRPHPGAVWVRGGWVWRHHHRVWVGGYWQ